MTGLAIAEQLQLRLNSLYEIETEHSVSEFLVSDPEVVSAVEGAGARDIPEKLLVRQDGEDVDLALYIDRALLERLEERDPLESLSRANLSDYLVLLEGVSHFVYLTFNAARERPVTLLELELQAEVDKFVTTLFQLGRQTGGRLPRGLRTLLFDEVTFDEQLDPAGRERYQTANRLAGKFCQRLERQLMQKGDIGDLIEAVRRFYRLPQEEKLRLANVS